MMWKCPKCGSDRLKVWVEVEARLHQYPGEDNFETEIDGDQEWDSYSAMRCLDCEYYDAAKEFEHEPR